MLRFALAHCRIVHFIGYLDFCTFSHGIQRIKTWNVNRWESDRHWKVNKNVSQLKHCTIFMYLLSKIIDSTCTSTNNRRTNERANEILFAIRQMLRTNVFSRFNSSFRYIFWYLFFYLLATCTHWWWWMNTLFSLVDSENIIFEFYLQMCAHSFSFFFVVSDL